MVANIRFQSVLLSCIFVLLATNIVDRNQTKTSLTNIYSSYMQVKIQNPGQPQRTPNANVEDLKAYS